ncbi:hypothetical protein, partial [Parachlamydia sp.]|uniref:hypothetical protein n=1 Tax=Parachlamydia sp. TaxID=2052048 RepID=UPI003D131236
DLGKIHTKFKMTNASLNSTKTIWQRFVSLFSSSEEEKEFHKVWKDVIAAKKHEVNTERKLWCHFKLSSSEAKIFKFFTSTLIIPLPLTRPAWTQYIISENKEKLRSSEGKLKEAYFRTVGNQHLPSSLEGSSLGKSLQEIKKEIKEFTKYFGSSLNMEARQELEDAQQHLTFAIKISTEIDAISRLDRINKSSEKKEELRNRLSDISYEIQSKITLLEKGKELLLPGGYTNIKEVNGVQTITGHAVKYVIKKQENDKFSFTVINTGAGAGDYSGTFSWLKYLLHDGKHSDYVFDDLAKDQLSTAFFVSLLEQNVSTKGNDHSISHIFNILISGLLEGDSSKIKEGRRHAVQTNGTCTHDSVCSWLETQLSPELFDAFNLYMTGSGLYRLQKIRKRHSSAHTISKITGTWQERTLSGQELIDVLTELGKSRFSEQRLQLLGLGSSIDRKILLTTDKQKKMLEKRDLLLAKHNKKILKKELQILKGQIAQLEHRVQAEEKEKSKATILSRIYTACLGQSSTFVTNLKKANEDREKIEKRLTQLNNPEVKQKLIQKITTINDDIKASEQEKSRLEQQKVYLLQLSFLPQIIEQHFNIEV